MALDIRVALARMLSRRDHPRGSVFVYPQAVRQFNSLLRAAQEKYPRRVDVQAMDTFPSVHSTRSDEFVDSAQRLQDALDTEPAELGEAPLMHHKFGILRSESQLIPDFDESMEDKAGIGIIFFDIDGFKPLNTKYTESVVDRDPLLPFQHSLVEIVSHRGYCYCVGGDEFIILLRNSDPRETLAFAERLAQILEDAPFDFSGEPERVTVSVGVANYPFDGKTLDDVRVKANYAENRAKANGRNQVIAYNA